MRYITTIALSLVLCALSIPFAFADTDVKVKVKDKPGIGQKAKVKGITQTRITEPVAAFSLEGDKTVTIQSLNAPGNPYVKVYSDFDRWVLENARPEVRFTDLKWVDGRWVYVENNVELPVVVARVNPQGYLLPVGDKTVVNVGPQVPVLPRGKAEGHYYVIAAGEPAPEVRKVYVRERARVLAPLAPKVPDWIIKEPGDRVIFTPDKDFIVLRDGVWYRYDVAGKVIAQTEPGQSWRVLLWPKYDEVVTGAVAKRWTVLDDSGYVVVRDGSGKVVTVYDYDGTPLKVEEVKVEREPFYYTPLDWDTLVDLRDVQMRIDVDAGPADAEVKVIQ
jgi:hypothetical protein